jgi:hypothetical protein
MMDNSTPMQSSGESMQDQIYQFLSRTSPFSELPENELMRVASEISVSKVDDKPYQYVASKRESQTHH